MQYWDNILYPPFLATIRGEYYGIITQDELDEECYNLACRAISTFKFPRISTEYETFYAVRDVEREILHEVNIEDHPEAIPHGCFINDLTQSEIAVIIAWMKAYWCENQLSSSNNFEDVFTDSNIKTYSRANLVDKTNALWKSYVAQAKELENNYGRVKNFTPTLGDINS